jgi:hypothetical protein
MIAFLSLNCLNSIRFWSISRAASSQNDKTGALILYLCDFDKNEPIILMNNFLKYEKNDNLGNLYDENEYNVLILLNSELN